MCSLQKTFRVAEHRFRAPRPGTGTLSREGIGARPQINGSAGLGAINSSCVVNVHARVLTAVSCFFGATAAVERRSPSKQHTEKRTWLHTKRAGVQNHRPEVRPPPLPPPSQKLVLDVTHKSTYTSHGALASTPASRADASLIQCSPCGSASFEALSCTHRWSA